MFYSACHKSSEISFFALFIYLNKSKPIGEEASSACFQPQLPLVRLSPAVYYVINYNVTCTRDTAKRTIILQTNVRNCKEAACFNEGDKSWQSIFQSRLSMGIHYGHFHQLYHSTTWLDISDNLLIRRSLRYKIAVKHLIDGFISKGGLESVWCRTLLLIFNNISYTHLKKPAIQCVNKVMYGLVNNGHA